MNSNLIVMVTSHPQIQNKVASKPHSTTLYKVYTQEVENPQPFRDSADDVGYNES